MNKLLFIFLIVIVSISMGLLLFFNVGSHKASGSKLISSEIISGGLSAQESKVGSESSNSVSIAPQQFNGWIIEKTNAEVNLDVKAIVINETASRLELSYLDKNKYYAELKAYLEKTTIDKKTGESVKYTDEQIKTLVSKFPVVEKSSLTASKEINMDSVKSGKKTSIEFSYSNPKDVELKLGYGTIYVIANLSTNSICWINFSSPPICVIEWHGGSELLKLS